MRSYDRQLFGDDRGGVMADNGSRNVPNAQLYIARSDLDHWTNDAVMPAAYPARKAFLGQAQENLLPNRDRPYYFKDGEEFLPRITALAAPGHTVGHTIFMIQSGNEQPCCIGDLGHHPVLPLEHPRTQFAFDTDPAQSAESRVRMVSMLAANRTTMLAYHFARPGIGHVAKAGDGFRYFPQPMNMVL